VAGFVDTIRSVNPLLLYFASGESLYPGAGTLLLVVAITPWIDRPWKARLRNIAVWLGLALMLMSCPPFSCSIDVAFGVVLFFWFIVWNRETPGRIARGLRVASMVLLLVLLVLLPAMEFPHRSLPTIVGSPASRVTVIGDSISAGVSSSAAPWPAIMQRMTGVEVKNLSRPGATVADGKMMAGDVTPDDRLVIIEIGGNDLLANAPADIFSSELEDLAAKLSAPGRTVVMFELPLLPQKIKYGQVQRRVALKYGFSLIPKRYLAHVFATEGATSDGLHLTEAGARQMALLVAQILSPVLQPPNR
jgi:acyl-CoA thioesterase-1